MDNTKKVLKSAIWYTISNFFIKGIGFITMPVFTRLLTKEEFGKYNNYLSWLAIITIFVTLHLESTLISARFDFQEKFDEYILSVLSLSTLSALFWIIAVNIFSNQFVLFLDLNSSYINAMLIYLLFYPAVTMFQAREQYYFEYKKTVIASIILSVGTAALSVVLVLSLRNRLTGRILGTVIPMILLGMFFYLYFVKKGKKIEFKYWKYALPICLPYIPHLLSMTLLNSTDRIMINKFCNAEDTAMYSLAYTCGTMITLFLTSLNNAYAPWLGEKLDKNDFDSIKSFSKIYMCVFFLFSVGIMLVAPEVLLALGGKSYMEAKYVITPVTMGCVCQFLYTMFVNVEQFKKKTVGMAVASLIAALINLGLNYIFIPQIGYLAAAYTTLAGYICLLLMHMYLVYRLKSSKIYSYKFVLKLVLIGLFVTGSITFLYSYNIIRYCCCGVYMCVVYFVFRKNKNTLLSFVRRRK